MLNRIGTVIAAISLAFSPFLVQARTSELSEQAQQLMKTLADATPEGAVIGVGQAQQAERGPTRLSMHIGALFEEALVGAAGQGGYRVVERAGLEQLAREWALGQSGMVDEETAAAAGKLSGASHFVFGGYTLTDRQLSVRAKLVDARTGDILAATRGQVRLDNDIQALAASTVTHAPSSPAPTEQKLHVEVRTDKKRYHCDDTLRFTVRANRDCYLTLIDINPRGEATVVYPNAYEPEGKLQGGVDMRIPTQAMGFDFIIEPPLGTEIVRAIVSSAPLKSLNGIVSQLSDSTPFAQPTDLVGLTRGIRVEGNKAPPNSWGDTAVRFRIER